MKLLRLFTDHPASVGETYAQHMRSAATFAIRLLAGGAACLTHAALPFLFQHTASKVVSELHQRMIAERSRHARIDRSELGH